MERIKAGLLELPEQIREARRRCEERRRALSDLEEELKARALRIRGEIAEEVDARGKPVFSNEVKREVEFTRRALGDPAYRELVEEAGRLRGELAEEEIGLRLLLDRFRAALALARLAAAELEGGGAGEPDPGEEEAP